MNKKDKIRLIILEGESDKHFFSQFKKAFDQRMLDISLLKAENLNFHRISREIKASLKVMKYKEVWLVIDLKTQKGGTINYYSTPNDMIADYKKNLKHTGSLNYVIMVQDLECWLLLYFSKHGNTQTISNSEETLKKLMNIKGTISKKIIVQRLTAKSDFWEKLLQNRHRNKSFHDFLTRVDPDLGSP
jgi:hypothetical protein